MKCQENDLPDRLAMARTVKAAHNSYTTMYNQALMPLGLTCVQCEILMYLYQRPSERMETDELLRLLQISCASLSVTLKKLKEKGYIRYLPGNDMRKKQISLTVKALEVQDQLTAALQQLEDISFQQITDSECEEVRNILQKMIQNIEHSKVSNGG